MAPNGEAVGYFGWRHDQDWYRVPLDGLRRRQRAQRRPRGGARRDRVAAGLRLRRAQADRGARPQGRARARCATSASRPASPTSSWSCAPTSAATWTCATTCACAPRSASRVRRAASSSPTTTRRTPSALADGTRAGLPGARRRRRLPLHRRRAAGAGHRGGAARAGRRASMEVLREPDGALLVRADDGQAAGARAPAQPVRAGGLDLDPAFGGQRRRQPRRAVSPDRRQSPARGRRRARAQQHAARPRRRSPAGASGNGLLYPKGDVDFWQAPLPSDGAGEVAVTVTGVSGMALDVRALTLAIARGRALQDQRRCAGHQPPGDRRRALLPAASARGDREGIELPRSVHRHGLGDPERAPQARSRRCCCWPARLPRARTSSVGRRRRCPTSAPRSIARTMRPPTR